MKKHSLHPVTFSILHFLPERLFYFVFLFSYYINNVVTIAVPFQRSLRFSM